MAFNQVLADRIENIFKERGVEVVQKKMFGGMAYLYKGKMTVGVMKENLTVRIISKKIDEHMDQPYTSPMNFTGKVMKEFAYVNEEGFKSDFELDKWVDLGLEHAKTKLKEI